jgi:hypothetical protein
MKLADLQRVKELSEELSYLKAHRQTAVEAKHFSFGVRFVPGPLKTWDTVVTPAETIECARALALSIIDGRMLAIGLELQELGVEVPDGQA